MERACPVTDVADKVVDFEHGDVGFESTTACQLHLEAL